MMDCKKINEWLADPVEARMLEALCAANPGGISRLKVAGGLEYFTFTYCGDECVVDQARRAELEAALGAPVTEVTYPDYQGEVSLAVPEFVRARLLRFLREGQASISYAEMTSDEQAALDARQGVTAADRERVESAVAAGSGGAAGGPRAPEDPAEIDARVLAAMQARARAGRSPRMLRKLAEATDMRAVDVHRSLDRLYNSGRIDREGRPTSAPGAAAERLPGVNGVGVTVINRVALEALAKADDRGVPGVYFLGFDEPLPRDGLADVALDCFHSQVPVGMPDDFSYTVFDPITGVVYEPNPFREAFASRVPCHIEKLEDEPLGAYTVQVRAFGGGVPLANADLGVVQVVAGNQAQAKMRARRHLWSRRLDEAHCTPAFEILGEERAPEPATVEFEVPLKVRYRLAGRTVEDLAAGLKSSLDMAVQMGMLGDRYAAEVVEHSYEVLQRQVPLDGQPAEGADAAQEETRAGAPRERGA